jgi:hypothetical protein
MTPVGNESAVTMLSFSVVLITESNNYVHLLSVTIQNLTYTSVTNMNISSNSTANLFSNPNNLPIMTELI